MEDPNTVQKLIFIVWVKLFAFYLIWISIRESIHFYLFLNFFSKVLFLNFSSDQNIRNNAELKEKWDQLENLTEQMINPIHRRRATCAQILEKSSFWLIDKDLAKNRLDFALNSKFFNKFLSLKTVSHS